MSYVRPPRRTGIPIPTAVLLHTWRSDLTLRLSGISILPFA